MTDFIKFALQWPERIKPKGSSLWLDCAKAKCNYCPNRDKNPMNCEFFTQDEVNYLQIANPELFI